MVPDFTAGLIFGFTGHDHKAELEGCMTDLQPLADDAMKTLADLKALHFLAVAGDIGNFIWMLPNAVSSCEKLEELNADLQVMLNWAEILKNPLKVSKIASKNWLFHGTEIKADVATEQADWAKGDYYGAGDYTAKAMLTLVPLNSVNEAIDLPPLDPMVPDFTAGLIMGFTGNDHRAQLEGCMTNLQPLADDAMKTLADLKAFHFLAVAGDIGNFIWMLPNAVSSCEQLTQLNADLQVMLNWAEILKHPMKVSKIASKNWLFHGTEIKADITTEQADWNSGDYYGAGEYTAKAMLGLVPLSSDSETLIMELLLQ